MSLTKLLILFLSALVGGLIAFKVRSEKRDVFQFVLTFGGAYLFVITIIHVLPELYSHVNSTHGIDGGSATVISLLLLAGFFFQKVLEHFSSGIEHGHFHAHLHLNPLAVVGALCIHAFVDGLILIDVGGHEHMHHGHGSQDLLMGIVLHKLPAAFVMVSVLKSIGSSKKFLFVTLLIFALSSPLGQVLGTSVVKAFDDQAEWVHYLTAFVAGNFLHISTTIFLESSSDHSINWKKMLAVLAGASLALLTFMLL